ncbi:ATP phosphoribosyltransferase regulatory subunit [Aliidongia dinghuensis]|uniref:ATP phosphoribosyltransferase regulatory subunit n=2 Tax=Aliidongia dinghuensis TaxID=1867774 RepID=A0A8J2YU83_9PROT|nr:ATP phosphoribosyltransferase regulatory subunit [Aliidongia dinghuensis]
MLHPALLPHGLRDLLPPDAQIEADTVERLMAILGHYGYDRVKPPLVEFESSLLEGPGVAMTHETFRLMDPISHRMIAVRADMTLQIARIATTRLVKAPRPLRLSYAGQVLRVRGSQLRPERQVGQVGAELIGAAAPEADAEVIAVAVEALTAVGVPGLSVDLTLPVLVPVILEALGVESRAAERIRAALDHKDAAAIAEIGGQAAGILGSLMAAAGPADRTLAQIQAIQLPERAAAEVAALAEIVRLIRRAAPDLMLTIDPVENRGFEYHTGVSFTIFARNIRGELGRGGRYIAGGYPAETGYIKREAVEPQPSTGFTLYTDTVLRALVFGPQPPRVFLPHGTEHAVGVEFRADGWITVAGLEPVADTAAEARRLGCSHVLADGKPAEI